MTGKQSDNSKLIEYFSRRQFLAASAASTVSIAGCLGGGDDGDDDSSGDGAGDNSGDDTGEDDEDENGGEGDTDDGEEPEPIDSEEVPGPGSTVVEDPPDAVYLPTHREALGMLPTQQAGDYLLLPHYTYPHTFWLMRGEETEEVTPTEQTLHFMIAFWDAETGQILPVDVAGRLDIRKDGERIGGPRNLWPMISQGMGFHFGDNVVFATDDHGSPFPEEGTYEVEIGMEPISARKTGAFEGRFEESVSTTFEFEFSTEDFEAITQDVEFFAEERWGERDAMPLMNHGPDDRPEMALPPAGAYPGQHLGTHESHDADFVVQYIEDARLAEDGEDYLLVSPRTPYNRIPLTNMSLSVEGDIDGALTQTLDSEVGYHYGLTGDLSESSAFDIVVESPPQVARHQGYETAFLDMSPLSVSLE